MRTTLIALTCILSGCDASGTGIPASGDMIVSTGPQADMAPTADLANPSDIDLQLDLASGPAFCANTGVAGTCAQAYFGAVAQCFVPTGACVENSPNNGPVNTCWQSGAELLLTIDAMAEHVYWKAQNGGVTCMRADVSMGAGNTYEFRFTTTSGTLTFVLETGAIICPDGSMANIGINYGNCSALENLINGPPLENKCPQGPCP